MPTGTGGGILKGRKGERGAPVSDDRGARIEAYLKRLYGYAYSLCGDPHQAEDLVHDGALKALAARRVPVDEPAFRAWLFRIVRNVFLDRVRHEKVAADALGKEYSDPATEFWQGDDRFFSALTVKLEMEKLPRPQREILALIDIAGLSYAETAHCLDIPVGTVMSRISRARAALLEAMSTSNVQVLPLRKTKSGMG